MLRNKETPMYQNTILSKCRFKISIVDMKTSIVRKRRPTQVGMSPEVADKQKLAETPDTTLRLAPGFSHGLSR